MQALNLPSTSPYLPCVCCSFLVYTFDPSKSTCKCGARTTGGVGFWLPEWISAPMERYSGPVQDSSLRPRALDLLQRIFHSQDASWSGQLGSSPSSCRQKVDGMSITRLDMLALSQQWTGALDDLNGQEWGHNAQLRTYLSCRIGRRCQLSN